MNKGFAYYFKQAFKMSAQTIWKNKNLLKSMLYFFMSLVARLTVILGALVDLADVRQAKITKNSRTVDIPQSLTRASQKPLWTKIMATVLEALIYLGGFLLVSIVCGVIFAIGFGITQFVDQQYFAVISIIFAVPCLIIYAVYTIIVMAVFAPTSYVIDTNPALSAGDVVSVCVSTMKNRGKVTTILSVFVPALIIGAIAGICGAGFAAIILLLGNLKYVILLIVLWTIVTACILGLTVPVFTMTQNLSLVLLFEDIALDPVNANKRTSGINITKISGARVDREEIADNLTALFDEGIEEKTPDSEELVHKHKKRKKKEQPVAAAQTAAPLADDGAVIEEVDDYADEAPATASAPQTTAEQPAQPQQPVPPQGMQQPRSVPPQGMQQPRPVPPQGAQQPRPVPPQGMQQPRPVPPQGAQQPRPVPPQGAQQPRPVPPQGAQQPRPVPPQGAQQPRPVPPQGAQQPRPVPPQGAQQPRPVPPQGAQQPRPVPPQGNGANGNGGTGSI